MNSFIKILFIGSFLIFFTGCSMKGQKYQPDFNTINELKDRDVKKLAVSYNQNNSVHKEITLRSVKMVSPYGGSFNRYLEIALEENLKHAFIYDEDSNIKIIANLIQNDVNTFTGENSLKANFKVLNENEVLYDKNHSVIDSWSTSILAYIAIENAIVSYPESVKKLIDKFLTDEDFLKAVKSN